MQLAINIYTVVHLLRLASEKSAGGVDTSASEVTAHVPGLVLVVLKTLVLADLCDNASIQNKCRHEHSKGEKSNNRTFEKWDNTAMTTILIPAVLQKESEPYSRLKAWY